MTEHFSFKPFRLPCEAVNLRREVKTFIDDKLPDYPPLLRARSWMGFDAQFSRELGKQGWLGMTWPSRYGGHERSNLERYVVIEELLAAGAPVGAHWIADRQSGPQILRFGTERAKQQLIPAIARGEMFFCIGMSEPNAGSDLASVTTTARKVDGGWLINGAKIWTTIVHRAHFMITLVRTSEKSENRHAGLSQFIIDLNSPGVTRRPITDHLGEEHFGEVFLDDVFVPDDMLLGREGDGWAQVNAELALERSGPERYLSSYQLLVQFIAAIQDNPSEMEIDLAGMFAAELWTIRQMSLSVAGKLASGQTAVIEAAMVKDLGACFEQSLPPDIQAAILPPADFREEQPLQQVLTYLLKSAPSFSLRGGTREILRSIISKGIGLQ